MKRALVTVGLGLALVVTWCVSAIAADLPSSKPIEYVKPCTAFGAGYWHIPGSEACLQISGRVRTDAAIADGETDLSAKGYLYLTSMTPAEYGLIKTYAEFMGAYDDAGNASVELGDIYLQMGWSPLTVTAGRTGSLFDGFTGYSELSPAGVVWSDTSTLQVTGSYALGNGFVASVSVEDSDYRAGEDSFSYVAALEYGQTDFDVKVSAAFHDSVVLSKDDWGYAFNVSSEYRFTDQFRIGGGFQYSKAAASYSGLDMTAIPVTGYPDDALDLFGAQAMSFSAGVEYGVSDDVAIAFDASYGLWEIDELPAKIEGDVLRLNSAVTWEPIENLMFAFGVGYENRNVEVKNTPIALDDDHLAFGARVQYTF